LHFVIRTLQGKGEMRTYWLIGEDWSRRRLGTPVGSASTRLKRSSFGRRRRSDLPKNSSLPSVKPSYFFDRHGSEVG